jgi:hypothetical protein
MMAGLIAELADVDLHDRQRRSAERKPLGRESFDEALARGERATRHEAI